MKLKQRRARRRAASAAGPQGTNREETLQEDSSADRDRARTTHKDVNTNSRRLNAGGQEQQTDRAGYW